LTHAEVTREVIAVLRRVAPGGSSREITESDSLGEFGLGLDSLALLHFITALEKRFDTEIPESIWVDRGQLHLVDLINLIAEAVKDKVSVTPGRGELPPRIDLESGHLSRWEKLAAATRRDGLFPTVGWVARKAVAESSGLLYRKDRYHILSFDLTSKRIPVVKAPGGATQREVGIGDLSAADGLWHKAKIKEKHRLFEDRLKNGFIGFATWIDGRIAGLCWVAMQGDHEPQTGLHIKTGEGSCYGLDLEEHPDYRGQGVGLATMVYSMHRARERGYRVLFSVVHSGNERMLGAAIQILGYATVGEIVTERYLGHSKSVCVLAGRTVEGKTLILETAGSVT
jgi:acyl carrier protein/GNAT superfamily N-acetyltransferase